MTRTRSTAEILALVERATTGTHNEIPAGGGLIWCLSCGTISNRSHVPAKVALDTSATMPVEGCTRCACGSKSWDGNVCHSCHEIWDGVDYT